MRSPEKKRNLNLEKIVLSKEADFVLQDENIDLIFEATGDKALALKIIRTAFTKNKKVITANKALLAEKWLLPLLISYLKIFKVLSANWDAFQLGI